MKTVNTKIELKNGQEAIMIGAYDQFEQPAVVELSVVKRLAAQLKKKPLFEVIEDFKEGLNNVATMEAYIQVMEREMRFHVSVNQIEQITL